MIFEILRNLDRRFIALRKLSLFEWFDFQFPCGWHRGWGYFRSILFTEFFHFTGERVPLLNSWTLFCKKPLFKSALWRESVQWELWRTMENHGLLLPVATGGIHLESQKCYRLNRPKDFRDIHNLGFESASSSTSKRFEALWRTLWRTLEDLPSKCTRCLWIFKIWRFQFETGKCAKKNCRLIAGVTSRVTPRVTPFECQTIPKEPLIENWFARIYF